jgi:signal transduction histidine kinase
VAANRVAVTTGMVVATAGALVPALAATTDLPPAVRAGVLAATPLAVAGVAQVALRGPPTVVYAFAIAAVAVHAAGYNPFADPACSRVCADVPPVLDGALSTRASVTAAALLALCGCVVAIAQVIANRASVPLPVVLAVPVALVALAVAPAPGLLTWDGRTLAFVAPAAVALVGLAQCLVAVRRVHRRAVVDRLLAALTEGDHVGIDGMHVAVPGENRWVDASGGPSPAEVPGAVVLSDEDGPAVRILPRAGVDRAEMLAGLTPTTRLALRNARLATLARARLADVRASQRRIVAAGDIERRRIERDLHDGAQQRLVSVAFHLRLALARADPAARPVLAAAEAGVRTALARIRRLAHGMFPAALATEGLVAALDDLAASSDVHVVADVPEVLPPLAAMTAYTVVAVVVATTNGPVRVEVDHRDGALVVLAAAPPGGLHRGPDLADAADRVGAAGGSLTVDADRVTAVIPCGS